MASDFKQFYPLRLFLNELKDQARKGDAFLSIHTFASALGPARTVEVFLPFLRGVLQEEKEEHQLTLLGAIPNLSQVVGTNNLKFLLKMLIEVNSLKETAIWREKVFESIRRLLAQIDIRKSQTSLLALLAQLHNLTHFDLFLKITAQIFLGMSNSGQERLMQLVEGLPKQALLSLSELLHQFAKLSPPAPENFVISLFRRCQEQSIQIKANLMKVIPDVLAIGGPQDQLLKFMQVAIAQPQGKCAQSAIVNLERLSQLIGRQKMLTFFEPLFASFRDLPNSLKIKLIAEHEAWARVYGHQACVQTFYQMIEQALLVEKNISLKHHALAALAYLSGWGRMSLLFEIALRQLDTELKIKLLQKLSAQRINKQNLSAIVQHFGQSFNQLTNWRTKVILLDLISKLLLPRSLESLMSLLKRSIQDKISAVREAAWKLGTVLIQQQIQNTDKIKEIFYWCLNHKNWQVRQMGARLLKALERPRRQSWLGRCLKDVSEGVRLAGRQALD